jgi:glycosyltransferase involved in cell wall biosynthesis
MALLEAMSAGMAIAAFDCPTGPRELLENGRSGLLVPEGDEAALSAALERLVADPALRARLGSHARERARAYAIDRVGERWVELLSGLGVPPTRVCDATQSRGAGGPTLDS